MKNIYIIYIYYETFLFFMILENIFFAIYFLFVGFYNKNYYGK